MPTQHWFDHSSSPLGYALGTAGRPVAGCCSGGRGARGDGPVVQPARIGGPSATDTHYTDPAPLRC